MSSYTSQQVNFSDIFASRIVAAFKTDPAAALLPTGKVRLSKDPDFNPTRLTVLADVTGNEADFSGYPAGGVSVVQSAPLNLGLVAIASLVSALFIGATDDPQISNELYGYWVDDGTDLLLYERFAGPAPYTIGVLGDFLDLTVLLPIRFTQAAA